jgi:hypothetical protein
MAFKWNILLRMVNVRLPFSLLFHVYSTLPIVGTVLPSTIGGDVYRFISLSKYKINGKNVLASMVVERVIATVATVLLALVSLGLAFYWMRGSWARSAGVAWTIGTGIGIVLVMFLVLVLSSKLDFNRLSDHLARFSFVRKLLQVYLVSVDYLRDPRTLAIVSFWSLLVQFAPIIRSILIVRGLGIDVSLLEMLIVVPIIILATRMPISIDGLGVQEGLYVALFGLVGVSASEAFLMSTMMRVIELLAALPWGIHYLSRGRQKTLPVTRPSAEEKVML